MINDILVSLRGYLKFNLATFIEIHVPSQESDQTRICVLGISIMSVSVIIWFHFGIVATMWYFRGGRGVTPWIWNVSVWLNFDNEMIKNCKKYNWYLHYIICEFQRINTIQSQICNYNLLHKQYSRLKTYMVINDILVSFRVDVWNHKTSLTPSLFLEVFLPS